MIAFKDFSFSGSGESYENYVSTEFSKKYDVSYEQPEEPEKDEYLEMFQHLMDLGYFDYKGVRDLHVLEESINWSLLKEVLVKYIKEDTLLFNHLNWTSYHLSHDQILKDHLPIINQRLAVLASLDGEMDYHKPLQIGVRNIYTRVLHHRLKTINQYRGNVSAPLSQESVISAYRVSLLAGEMSHQEFRQLEFNEVDSKQYNFLGKVKEIFLMTMTKENIPSEMLVFSTRNQSEIPFEYVYVHRGELITSKDERSFRRKARHKFLDFSSLKRHIQSRGSFDTIKYNQRNVFCLELLQVILWMKSYYMARLDFIWGEKSVEALKEFIKFESIPMQDMLEDVKEGGTVLNIRVLLEKLEHNMNMQTSDEDKEVYFEEQLEKVQSQISPNNEATEMKKKKSFLGKLWSKIKGVGVRIYNGVKEAINSSIRWLQKVGDWLVEKVVGPAINFFRNIIKKIRQAIRQFFVGFKRFMHFIFRKPVYTAFKDEQGKEEFIITKFDLDSDAINYIPKAANSSQINKHNQLITQLTDGLELFVKIVLTIIDILRSLVPPFGWIKLGFKIYRLIRKIIKGEFNASFSF